MNMLDNFLKYVSIDTTSNSLKDETPSNDNEFKLAKILFNELRKMNLEVHYDEKFCYVYAVLKGNESLPKIGFIAHLDTAEYFNCKNVKTNVIYDYDGSDIILNDDIVISSDNFPDLKNHIGKTMITSDGLTILGADDKAGIAEIMYMLNYFNENDIEHGDIIVCFNPDEEIGLGMVHLDKTYFNPDFAYVIDGSALGEISYENFNAASVKMNINGIVAHYGKAKDLMINAGFISTIICSMLPDERAENTDGRAGFFHLKKINGDVSNASIEYLICDFDSENFEKRKKLVKKIVDDLNKKYNNCIELDMECSYCNMYDIVSEKKDFINKTLLAIEKANVKPIIVAHRGCTDAANVSFSGIPCINLGIGVNNYHSVYEYIALEDMIMVSEILIQIVKIFSLEE